MNKIKIAVWITVILVIVVFGVKKLNYILRPAATDGAYRQIETFHNLPENSIEVIVLGSSHAYKGINTMEMYKEYGIGSYNYGFHWQKINTTRMFLEDALLTQHPKVVLIETYLADYVLSDVNMNGEIYYSRYLNNKKAVRKFLGECFGNSLERYVSYYIPLVQFHDNWNSLTQENFNQILVGSYHLRHMGSNGGVEDVYPIKIPDDYESSQKEFTEDAINVLDEIVGICKSNNIDIVFFTIPFEGHYYYSDAMAQYAKERGCIYIDVYDHMEEIGINVETDYFDRDHLNMNGAKKIADYFGKYLCDHYTNLTDFREIPGNLWASNPMP